MATKTRISSFAVWLALFFAGVALLPTAMVQLWEECASESLELEEYLTVAENRECPKQTQRVRWGNVQLCRGRCGRHQRVSSFRSPERLHHNGLGTHLRT